MSEFDQYVWINYKGQPYYARVVQGMYGSYYEFTYTDCGRHFSQTIRQQDAAKVEPPKFEKGQMVCYIGNEYPFTNVMVKILDNHGHHQHVYRFRYKDILWAATPFQLQPMD